MNVQTVLHDARQVLTLQGPSAPRCGRAAMNALGIVEHGSVVLAEDGSIAWVGPTSELQVTGDPEWIDCAGKVVMPTFVDSHTHVVWANDRRDELELRLAGASYEKIFAEGGGILASVRHARETTEDELLRQSLQRLQRMRRCGATSFEVKSGYGLDLDTELRQLRVARRLRDEYGFRIRTTCLAAHAVPQEFRGSGQDRARFVEGICQEILPAVAAEGLADYCDVFCDRGAFTVEEGRKVLLRARELGMQLRVHANEFGHTGGARLAAELGAASADHLLFLDEREREALRSAGVVATLLPGTSLVLGKPFADGRTLVDEGVAVAVATDCNPGSCPLENLAMVLGLACYGNRLSPAEAVCATTHNAAACLGLADRVGRIEPGLSADVMVLDTDDYRDLVYHTGSPLIRALYQGGRPQTLQPDGDRS